MSLFNFDNTKGKKKENQLNHCGCNSKDVLQPIVSDVGTSIESIKVLGMGCKSCHEQYNYVKQAIDSMKLNLKVEYITDLQKVTSYGVISVPAIVINDKVVTTGKILKSTDVEKLLHTLGF